MKRLANVPASYLEKKEYKCLKLLQSAFYKQPAFYPWSAVYSPQSAVRSLRLTLTDWRIPKFILIVGSLSNHDGDGNEESNRSNKVRSH